MGKVPRGARWVVPARVTAGRAGVCGLRGALGAGGGSLGGWAVLSGGLFVLPGGAVKVDAWWPILLDRQVKARLSIGLGG